MNLNRTDAPEAQVLFSLACLVVVVFGLRRGDANSTPLRPSLFLAVLSLPVMVWLRSHRFPKASAIYSVLLNVAVVGLLLAFASQSVAELQRELPELSEYACTTDRIG